jgi:hypothetical protein
MPGMCFWRPTHFQYAHQRVVATFGDLIVYYNYPGLTHISRILSYLAILTGVGYEVHRDITPSPLPNVEWSEEPPSTDEAEL